MNYGCIRISDLIYKNWRIQLVKNTFGCWLDTKHHVYLFHCNLSRASKGPTKLGNFQNELFVVPMLIWLPSQVGRESYLGSSSSQRVSKAPIMHQIMSLYGGHVGRKSSQNRMRSLTSVLVYFLIRLAET
jgi:hypothetical protein